MSNVCRKLKSKEMTVNELIQKLILGEIKLSQGLMLAKVLFNKMLTEESYQWICKELDHYEDAASMPEYRVVDCEVKVQIMVPYIGIKVETLDTSFINNQLDGTNKPYASPNKMLIRQGIESIEQSLEKAGANAEMLLTRQQTNLIMQFYRYAQGCSIEKAYQECRIENIANIIPSVRNKLITILQNEVLKGQSEASEHNETSKKRVFISYGWEEESHKNWVHNFANRLCEHFDVKIDVKIPYGIELNIFMEQMITKADRVLLILTPTYKEKADNRENGVGYESVLMSTELYKNQCTHKFIPIVRKGDFDVSYPIYLGTRKGVDMRNDDVFESVLEELVEDIRNN